MLNQKRSGNLARLKYLAALPVCAGLLCASTLGFSKTYGVVDIAPQKTITDTTVKITNLKLSEAKPLKLKQTNSNKPVKITDVKLLPPPPPANGDTVVTMTNTKLSQAKPLALKEVAANKPVKVIDVTPLPPPPSDPFEAFYKYIQKYVRYPTKGRDNLISGRVIATFNVTNGKIEDLQISRGLNNEMDGEVLRVLKNYDGKFPEQKSIIHYAIPVSFAIMDDGGNYVGNTPKGRFAAPKFPKSNDPKTTYMLNEVVVTTYAPKK